MANIPAETRCFVPASSAIRSVLRQARLYGEQVRLLEEAGLKEDRARVRKAWRTFLDQIEQDFTSMWWLARVAYNKAHHGHALPRSYAYYSRTIE